MGRGDPVCCPVCGQVPSANAKFCRRCGARLPGPSSADDDTDAGPTPELMPD